MAKKKDLSKTIEISEGVEVKVEGTLVNVKGEKGEIKRDLRMPGITIKIEENNVKISAVKMSKNEKRIIGTFTAHIRNMIKGVKEGHVYKLKICAGHFPMNVAINNNKLEVKNFLGEKYPRILDIIEGVDVKLDGQDITVESIDKEKAGMVASNIEQLCRITNRDRRIFQDGIYMTVKDGKELK